MTTHDHFPDASRLPRVVIVGGGFGGLATAKVLARAPVQVLLIDKVNHSLFQPLLYQVAGAMLDAGDIAFPIRAEFRRQPRVVVAMAEITGVDKARRCVFASRWPHPIRYDYLVLATGAEGSYFGHDEWAPHAPGMKTLADGIHLRSRILKVFEDAEVEEDPAPRAELTTFVVVGGGPTGCELAGTLAEMFRHTLKAEFRRFDPHTARIILVEAGPRVLPMFALALSVKAQAKLERLGVEVRLGHGVEQVDAQGVVVAGQRIAARNVIWTAGVRATPVARWLGVEADRGGRVRVGPDLSLPGHPEVFVVGDAALILQGPDGRPLPGIAPVALQSGHHVGRAIARRVMGKPGPGPFCYADKGMLATVSRGFAVLQSGPFRMAGVLAKCAWAFVHIFYLMENDDRVLVFLKWAYEYFTWRRGTRIIEEARGGG
jgi:NADH dehydrogenase FAD-containing subunit